ncbi:hypothetical protein H4S06_002842, partial [Coemansia sp. BCRC 34490]
FGVAAVYYALAVMITLESFRARNFGASRIAVLVALMLGGAFTARGVYITQGLSNSSSFTAFSVLDAIAPNFINLVNYIMLIVLLKGVRCPPPKRLLLAIRVFAIFMAVTFGAISTAGTVIVTSNASDDRLETAVKLIKASVAGQLSVNILFIVLASALMLKYRETLRNTRTVIIIYVGGLLLIARNAAKIVPSFYPQNSTMRDSEAAWYCLDPLFTLIIIIAWVVLDLPRQCQNKSSSVAKVY